MPANNNGPIEFSKNQRKLLHSRLAKTGIPLRRETIPVRPDGLPAPLSSAQERLWVLTRLTPDNPAFNIPVAYRLRGRVDLTALDAALNILVDRHQTLRTCFPERSDKPMQVILPSLTHKTVVVNLADRSTATQEAALEELIHAESRWRFDLSKAPLMRSVLINLGDSESVLLFTLHHIIADGWSLAILFDELSVFYRAILSGEAMNPKPLPLQYGDFAYWQRSRTEQAGLQDQLAYWLSRLGGEIPPLEIPLDRPRQPVQTFNGGWLARNVPEPLAVGLRSLAKREGVTLLTVLLAGFSALLARYSGLTDILFGSPVTNRTRADLESIVGHFVNLQALRVDMAGDPTFRETISRVRETLLEAYTNQEILFEQLLTSLRIERDPGKTPLFQIIFILQHNPAGRAWRSALNLPGLEIQPIFTHTGTAKYDLTVEVEELPAGLTVSMEYNTDLYDRDTLDRLAGHYLELLRGAIARPETKLSRLPMLTSKDWEEILHWNDTRTDYPSRLCVNQVFEEYAARDPDAVALRLEGQVLTYGQLNQRANQLAHHLRGIGVGAEVVVGLACDRSFELIVALMGILKAGGVYLPLDVNYPAERLAWMIEDSRAPLVLTQSHLAARSGLRSILPERTRYLYLDTDWPEISEAPSINPVQITKPDHLAYVMYTSGSTGRPKGTAIPHRGIVRLVKGVTYAELSASDVFLQFSTISFDASTWEIWGALLNGARLAIFPPGQPSFEALSRILQDEGVSFLFLTSGFFHQMVEQHLDGLKQVRIIASGGDVVSASHVKTLLAGSRGGVFINGYGPTENTTLVTTQTFREPAEIGNVLPIGRPVANTTVYILDDDLQPLPVGVVGELYTGGDGLARGYLHQPGLTAEKFVPNPFGNSQRLYRIGDLARWRSDGTIEFLGRRDFQVKIRGFRIELGEIESSLDAHPDVKASAVIARGISSDTKRLIGYVVPQPDAELNSSELRRHLAARLPEYMIPSTFVILNDLPLTENGKLNRQALPEPGSERPALETRYASPRTSAEKIVAQIWVEVLNLDQVGLEDNFFDLGGDSLLMLQVHTKIAAAFEGDIPMIWLFTYPTVRSIAERLSAGAVQEARVDQSSSETAAARGTERRRRLQNQRRK